MSIHVRLRRAAALLPMAAVLAACSDNGTTTPSGRATVRVINATGTAFDARNDGVVQGSTMLFGSSSACLAVDPSGAAGTGLSFNMPNSSTGIPGYTPSLAAGGNYTVLAYPAANGTVQWLTIDNTPFSPASGQAGVRVINAAPGSPAFVLLANGTAVAPGTGTTYGTTSGWMNVPAGTQTVAFNTGTGTTTVAQGGPRTFDAGQRYTMIVGVPAPGTTTYRTVLVPNC
jgi:hypothetical protein